MSSDEGSRAGSRSGSFARTAGAAVLLLTAMATIAPTIAQQADPAAAHKAKCDPLIAAIQPHLSKQKEAANRSRQTVEKFNQALSNFQQSHAVYVRLRDSGEHVQAWQAASTLDIRWAQVSRLNEELIAHRTANASASRPLCDAQARAIAAGCVKVSGESCMARLEKLQASIGDLRSRSARYAKTWKTAADEKLNPANAAKGCPVAKAIAPRATVTAINGRAFAVRGMRTIPIQVGTQLHIEDVLSVEEDSSVTINLFSAGLLKISQKTKFEITDPRTSPPPRHIPSAIWTEAKRLLQGEKFEIKTPNATCGVRG